MTAALADAGIANPVIVEANGNQASDILYTLSNHSKFVSGTPMLRMVPMEQGYLYPMEYSMPTDWRVSEALQQVNNSILATPLAEGEQLNLMGYSTGSVTMAQAALQLANDGYVIDNLILIGAPILNDSPLYQGLAGNSNIRNIIRVDIPNDDVTTVNVGPIEKLQTFWNFGRQGFNHPHFAYAFPDDAASNRTELAEELAQQGVR